MDRMLFITRLLGKVSLRLWCNDDQRSKRCVGRRNNGAFVASVRAFG